MGKKKGVLQKSDLRGLSKVKHKRTGSVGEVLTLQDGTLPCIDTCVKVRTRTKTGKTKGKWGYPIWNIANLKLIEY